MTSAAVTVRTTRAESGAAEALAQGQADLAAPAVDVAQEVAAEAGWTTGALTHYLADKRELLLTTFQSSLANRRWNRATYKSTRTCFTGTSGRLHRSPTPWQPY